MFDVPQVCSICLPRRQKEINKMSEDVDIINAGMRFGNFWAIRHINVHIDKGEFFSFLGPSGCGKTTILKLISGHLEASEGEIRISERNMKGIGPQKRSTAMIFQNLALFPLLCVADNIGFGLEVMGVASKERYKRVDELLELVNLPGIGSKSVEDISGGQKQRVAIARALAVNPSVLLLDEPLSALDLKLRQHMRTELQKIQKQTGVTFIYITHDQGEALTMSERVAVMSKGKIEQLGSPNTIYNNPASPFVATFVGETNLLHGKISRLVEKNAQVITPSGTIICRNPYKLPIGTLSTIFIRPETMSVNLTNNRDKTIRDEKNHSQNQIEAKVRRWTFEGPFINLTVQSKTGEELNVRLSNDGNGMNLKADDDISVSFNSTASLLFSGHIEANR